MSSSLLVAAGILGISVLVAVGFLAAFASAQRRLHRPVWPALGWAGAGTLAWFGLLGGLAISGVLQRFDLRPPPMAFMFLACIGLGLGLGLSRVGESFARGLPLVWLVGAQGFRFPLELVMHQAAREGTMPHEMSFSGFNFDILTGFFALVLGVVGLRGALSRELVWAWNLVGSALLFNIGVVAVLASPMLRVFGSEPAHVNRWVVFFPFVFLPGVLVAAAVFGHVVVFRALRRKASESGREGGRHQAGMSAGSL
jgi:hypothetical protein